MENGISSYCRFLAGDDEGIVEIIRDYKDGLMLYINSMVHNLSLAEDLTEDTFVKIAVDKPKFKKKHSFKAWLYRIGRNITMDYFRKESKHVYNSIDDYADTSGEESPERDYIKNEDRLTVFKTMSTLKPDYRQVLFLVFVEQLSNGEVADIMGKSKRQVEQLLYNAKGALKRELEKGGFQYEKL